MNVVKLPLVVLSVAMLGCGDSGAGDGEPLEEQAAGGESPAGFQAVSFLGDSLFAAPSEAAREVQGPLLAEARAALDAAPDDPDAWIWVGRRLGYLQEYREALEVYGEALERFPDDARLYRHRGHRLISVRNLDAAIRDFDRAVELIQGTPDEVEPDGLPNARGIPTSTLHFNIWYHLGLAHFLAGDYEAAMDAYEACMSVSDNPDALVATSYWTYLTLMRLGREDEALRILEPIDGEMDIIENQAYRDLLLLYKGEVTPEVLFPEGEDSLSGATVLFGVANWHQLSGREEEALETLRRLMATDQWSSFGYIAGEADLSRS